MEDRIEKTVNNKKEWVAPELKKIDVEEATEGGYEGDNDGLHFS